MQIKECILIRWFFCPRQVLRSWNTCCSSDKHKTQIQHYQNHNKKHAKTTYSVTYIWYINRSTKCIERIQFKSPGSFVRGRFVSVQRVLSMICTHCQHIAKITITNKFKQHLHVQTIDINSNQLIANKECWFDNLFTSVQTQCINRTRHVRPTWPI